MPRQSKRFKSTLPKEDDGVQEKTDDTEFDADEDENA
jgi:hypothetical protein